MEEAFLQAWGMANPPKIRCWSLYLPVGEAHMLTPALPWHSHSGSSQCSRPWAHCGCQALASGGGLPKVPLVGKSGPACGAGALKARRTPGPKAGPPSMAQLVVLGVHGLVVPSVGRHDGKPVASSDSSSKSLFSGQDIQTALSWGRGQQVSRPRCSRVQIPGPGNCSCYLGGGSGF